MHGYSRMATTTISLDRSAYDLLRSRKRPDESFSDEIHRLLGGEAPSLRDFLAILPEKEAALVASSMEAARAEDLRFERERPSRRGEKHGRRP